MKKIWLLTTLLVGSLLFTGCSFHFKFNDTSDVADEDKPNTHTESWRFLACNEELGKHYHVSAFGSVWAPEQEWWASFVLSWEITYEKKWETIIKNVECVVDMVDNSVTIYEVESPEVLVTTEESMDISNIINLKIWDKTFDITLEDNSSTTALIEKLKEWDIVVNAHDYWNFEKVWDLWFDLPRNDEQITTQLWDLILYQWNQITLYYDTNSWNFTRLWKVQNITKSDLWDWDVTLVFSLIK